MRYNFRTNQIAGFGEFHPLTNLEKNKYTVLPKFRIEVPQNNGQSDWA